MWAPLFATPETEWHSLVVAPDAEPMLPLPNVHDHRASLTDFEATAQLITRCDLTITVDTATAHLAGALGLRYWLLLPQPPEWRWGGTGTTTPWYPLATIYRQPAPGAWVPVFERLHADLLALRHAHVTQPQHA